MPAMPHLLHGFFVFAPTQMSPASAPTFTSEEIAVAQALADRWAYVGIALMIFGLLYPVWGGFRGHRKRWCFLGCFAGLVAGSIVFDFVISSVIHDHRDGIIEHLKGGYGEQPNTPGAMFCSPFCAFIGMHIGIGLRDLLALVQKMRDKASAA